MAKKEKVSLSPEIIKLTEKMKNNPGSRFFLPLAEEYVKSGMIDQAIQILQEGLKSHPAYWSAMVLLGKVYLQKGMNLEAKAEFEKVIENNPDNILASKKLAQIYKDENDREKTINICRSILTINPKDEEIRQILVETELKTPITGDIKADSKEKESEPEMIIQTSPYESQEVIDNKEEDVLATGALADLYISQGHYEDGMEIYQSLLKNDPDNQEIKQKIEDAVALMNTGRQKTVPIPASQEGEENNPTLTPTLSLKERENLHPPIQGEGWGGDGTKELLPNEEEKSEHLEENINAEKIKTLESWLENIKRRRANGISGEP